MDSARILNYGVVQADRGFDETRFARWHKSGSFAKNGGCVFGLFFMGMLAMKTLLCVECLSLIWERKDPKTPKPLRARGLTSGFRVGELRGLGAFAALELFEPLTRQSPIYPRQMQEYKMS